MSADRPASRLASYSVTVSDKTTWVLLRLVGADGIEGAGEATLNGRTDAVLAAIPGAVSTVNTTVGDGLERCSAVIQAIDGVVGRAAASAIEQAWLDRRARQLAVPVAKLHGGSRRDTVASYANINRGTLSRTPAEFADRAAIAVAKGYKAVKLAPFDGVVPDQADNQARAELIAAGFARVAAVCGRVGGQARVQVDCHSRFRFDEAQSILETLSALGITWFEEPVRETADVLARLSGLRVRAGELGVSLVGAENVAGVAGIEPVLATRAYDIVMPDIILSGGPSEVVCMGHLVAAVGSAVSLHNPCGPVMDAHSLQAAAALPELHSLERQFEESPLYEDIIVREQPTELVDGALRVPDRAGLGLAVDWRHPDVRLNGWFEIDI